MADIKRTPPPGDAFREKVAELTRGLLYISEGEAPVELLQWPEIKNNAGLQEAITRRLSIPQERQSLMKGEDLLRSIHSMASPDDLQMTEWVIRWDALLGLLGEGGRRVTIVRGEGTPVQLIIASFGNGTPLLLHTTAVET